MNEPLQPDRFYHYFNRANSHENLFIEEQNYTYFLKLLARHILPVAEFYSYCLMPNHFHLVLRMVAPALLPKEYAEGWKRLSQPFSNCFNAYTKAMNRRYGRRGSLFQEHPKHQLIASDEYLRNVILYVNANPTHHGMGNYETYPHSSYNAIISSGRTAIKRHEVLGLFGDLDGFTAAMAQRSENMAMELEYET